MKAKKITSLLLTASMVAGMTAGLATTVMADEEQVLKVAVVETAYGQDMWKNVCAKFEEANPGVTVELTIDKKTGRHYHSGNEIRRLSRRYHESRRCRIRTYRNFHKG